MDKILRSLSAAIVIFATVIAFVVGSRIDQNTISLLSGAIIGILIATPCAIIITIVTVRRRENNSLSSYDRNVRHNTPLPPNPPQYWVMPQQFAAMAAPAYMQAMGAAQAGANEMGFPPRPSRRFYVIGENGEARMLESSSAHDAATNAYELEAEGPGSVF